MIKIDAVWYPASHPPIPGTLALVALDKGADCDPEEFRIYLLHSLYEWRETPNGAAFFNIDHDTRLEETSYLWTSYEDLVLGIEGALDMEAWQG